MYGILVDSVKDAIIKQFGIDIWNQVEGYLGLENLEILSHSIYSDDLFPRIIEALITFREMGDFDYYMEFFGKSFVKFFSNYGFEKMLRVAGRGFRDFLYSIDQMHESNRYTFPKMQSPIFYVDKEDEKGLYLHYQSKRKGFNSYIIGQLKEIATVFYKLEIKIYISQDFSTTHQTHVIFRIDFENKEYLEKSKNVKIESMCPVMTQINSQTLLKLFPFAFGIDRNLKVKYVGSIIESLFKDSLIDVEFYKAFNICRPSVKLDWDMILAHSNSIIFELESSFTLADQTVTRLKMKGQMKYIKDLDMILFLGHPVLSSMEEMQKVGLYLNDLNKFDGSAEWLVTEMQNNSKLQKAFEAQQAWTTRLESNRKELKTWKKKGKKLLYSMLPERIARLIEIGVQPNSICENFEQVTILFVNTADFGSIINNSQPTEIIEFINSTISVYDKIVSTFDKVNKIETKADGSYMIVAGLENEKKFTDAISTQNSMVSLKMLNDDEDSLLKREFPEYNQVELICAVALEIIENCSQLHNPFNNDTENGLKIKVGFHTGSIVAGIVGLSNIQFCLFGDTVNTASRMCSNSEPGKVCFSEASYAYLEKSKHFKTTFRDSLFVKGKGWMKTYWLNGKN